MTILIVDIFNYYPRRCEVSGIFRIFTAINTQGAFPEASPESKTYCEYGPPVSD